MILALFYQHSLGYLRRTVKLSDAIEQQNFKQAIDAVKALRPIDIADIIVLIKPKLAWQLLEQLPNRSRIFAYEECTAGALISSDDATLAAQMTVSDALDLLRLEAPDAQAIYHTYGVDETRQLLGVLIYLFIYCFSVFVYWLKGFIS